MNLNPGQWFCLILAGMAGVILCWAIFVDYLTEKARVKYGDQGKETKDSGNDLG